jgi:hypothetical protein
LILRGEYLRCGKFHLVTRTSILIRRVADDTSV